MGAAVALRGALPALQLLKHFSMANCYFKGMSEILSEIMVFLRAGTGLEKLDLSESSLTENATAEVAEALRALSHLQTISLPPPLLPCERRVLLDALHGTKGLLRVDLQLADHGNDGWAHGVEVLIDLINASDSLRCVVIDFGDCFFENPGDVPALQHCLAGVAMKDPLKMLDLCQYAAWGCRYWLLRALIVALIAVVWFCWPALVV